MKKAIVIMVSIVLILCTALSIYSMENTKPKTGLWKGSPQLSFKVTSEGEINDLVYTVIPGMMGNADCKVILTNIPIEDNRVDSKMWIDEKGGAAFHIVGTFTSDMTFEGSGTSLWCTVGDTLASVGMMGHAEKSLSAKYDSEQEEK